MKIQIAAIVLVLGLGQSLAASRDRNDKPYKVVCYWGSWSSYGTVQGKFEAEDINPHLCTHLNYAFAVLKGNQLVLEDAALDHDMIIRFNKLRHANPHLTTLISIGGWAEGSTKYSHMVATATGRKEFVGSVMNILRQYDFDGLDIDWEYPGFVGNGSDSRKLGRAQDKQDFIELLKELKQAFQPGGYILTAAVGAGRHQIDTAYDVKELDRYLDFINFMTYAFNTGDEPLVGHDAALYPMSNTTADQRQLTAQFAVDYWRKLGGDPKKLIFGFLFYGYGYVLAKGSSGEIGSPADGALGEISYNEICVLTKQGWRVKRNLEQQVPYAMHASQWIGFDDVASVKAKINYLKANNLGGAMVWSVNGDDHRGLCGEGKFPLLKTISGLLNNVTGPDVAGRPPTGLKKDPFNCTKAGFFADPHATNKFYQCVDYHGHFYGYSFRCPRATLYDPHQQACA